jgi:group I intron endonuclease
VAPPKINFSGIYVIRNRKNGKRYIGSAVKVYARRNEHFFHLARGKHHSQRLQHSWNKHGVDAFEWLILEAVEKERLVEREQFWIDHFRSADPKYGYNINPKAQSALGVKRSPEYIERMRARLRGQTIPPERRIKISEALKGREKTPDECAKLSAAALARHERWRTQDPVMRRRISEKTRATKLRQSAARLAAMTPEELAAKEERARRLAIECATRSRRKLRAAILAAGPEALAVERAKQRKKDAIKQARTKAKLAAGGQEAEAIKAKRRQYTLNRKIALAARAAVASSAQPSLPLDPSCAPASEAA